MKINIYKITVLIAVICLISSCGNNQEQQSSKEIAKLSEVGFELFQTDTSDIVEEDTLMDNLKGLNNVNAFTSNCIALLNPLYTTFKVQDDYTLLVTLDEIYSLDREKYNNKRSSSGLSAWLPSYGSGSYNSGKAHVASLKEKYRGQTNFKFDENEHRQVQISFVEQQTAKDMYDAFNRCNDANQYLPRLVLVSNNKSKVVCNLYLPFSRYNSTKINSIVSGNLILNNSESDIKSGSRVRYGSPYNIVFNRQANDENGGEIVIALKNEQPLKVSFNSVEDGPVYEYKFVSSDENGNAYKVQSRITFNYKNKTITHSDINGASTVSKWNRKVPVSGKILTQFNSDSILIENVHSSYNQHILFANWELQTYPNSKLVDIQTTIRPTKKTSTVTYTIYYKKLRKVCVRNCPEQIE